MEAWLIAGWWTAFGAIIVGVLTNVEAEQKAKDQALTLASLESAGMVGVGFDRLAPLQDTRVGSEGLEGAK
jgi:hypothetical protein